MDWIEMVRENYGPRVVSHIRHGSTPQVLRELKMALFSAQSDPGLINGVKNSTSTALSAVGPNIDVFKRRNAVQETVLHFLHVFKYLRVGVEGERDDFEFPA